MKVVEYTESRGQNARRVKGTKLALSDTLGALELLGTHLRLFTQEHQHEVEPDSDLKLWRVFLRGNQLSDSELDDAVSALDEVAPQ
jgi:hypothetical protein